MTRLILTVGGWALTRTKQRGRLSRVRCMSTHHPQVNPAPVFVFGHRNPDTDTVVSAVIAAQLKGELDPSQEFQPLLLGEANRQTKWLFSDAGIPLPPIREDLRYEVHELMTPPLHTTLVGEHLGKAMDLMQRHQLNLVSVVDGQGRLLGILSDHLPQNQYFFTFNVEDFLGVLLDLGDLVQSLPLEPIDPESIVCTSNEGRLVLLSHDPEEFPAHLGASDIVIVGPHRPAIAQLIHQGVCAIIVADSGDSFCASLSQQHGTVPLFRFRGSLLALASQLPRAIPVEHVMAAQQPVLRPGQLIHDVIDLIIATPHPLPVVDSDGRLVGIFSRKEALERRPRPVILVDHVERSQSIFGFDLAEIVEIIDHHRLSDVQTLNPVRIDCRPIGSTASILALQFREAGKTPSPIQARLLLGAMVSDTLLLTSPTTTPIDRELAVWLAALAQVSLNDWGRDVLAQNDELADGDPEKLVMKDCKEFTQGDCRFRAAQIETMSLDLLTLQRRKELQQACDQARGLTGATFLVLMVTDVLRGDSRLLISDSNAKRARHLLQVENLVEGRAAPGWVSRKKQLLPFLFGQLGSWRP